MDEIDVKTGQDWLDQLTLTISNRVYHQEVSISDVEIWNQLTAIEGNMHDLLFDWYMALRGKGFFNRTYEGE